MGWQPTAPLDAIRARAELNSTIRTFFADRGVLEVETPQLSAAAVSDPYLDPLVTCYVGPGADSGRALFMHTSPEYPMKRLLAAGVGAIYQLARVFRNGESGRRHNPEFSMLEWYRPGFDDQQLMDEVEALVCAVLTQGPFRRLSYRQAFSAVLGVDPLTVPVNQLQQLAAERLGADFADDSRDTWLTLLFSECVEPTLRAPTFVYDFPASQAALAKVAEDERGAPVARRFELFVNGMELANGYHELTDAAEQAARFAADAESRRALGKPVHPQDRHLVDALQAGMPECAGVALGVDRLLMLKLGADHIDQVLTFPLGNA